MNNKELSLFFMLTLLLTMISIGYSIRQYLDALDYIKLGVSLALVAVILFIARIFYKTVFTKSKTLSIK